MAGAQARNPQVTSTRSPVRTDIEIGGVTVRVCSDDSKFQKLLHERFDGFVRSGGEPHIEFDIELTSSPMGDPDADVHVFRSGEEWHLERGDFRAEWNPQCGRGHIRQSVNPYAIDSVLRIVHSIVLAREGGLLVHAASCVRNERAFLFSGKSGAGKTTISRLAPRDAHLLSDEISYIRTEEQGWRAWGTPFSGELAKPGENVNAPLHAIYLLAHGKENRIDDIASSDAARAMLGNVLFFAKDPQLVQMVFQLTLGLVETVPVRSLTFVPDSSVWEMIQ